MRRRRMNVRKLIESIIVSICFATLAAAAKSYVDVEKLKTSYEYLTETLKEVKEDVKYIRRNIPKK